MDLRGGTDVAWSPPVGFTQAALVPWLQHLGVDVRIDILQRGFYPIGRGHVRCHVNHPLPKGQCLRTANLTTQGTIVKVVGTCYTAGQVPNHLANAMIATAEHFLGTELQKDGGTSFRPCDMIKISPPNIRHPQQRMRHRVVPPHRH